MASLGFPGPSDQEATPPPSPSPDADPAKCAPLSAPLPTQDAGPAAPRPPCDRVDSHVTSILPYQTWKDRLGVPESHIDKG